jgi:single-strand DNA-binding protein
MASNSTNITGQLTRDPELKFVGNGNAVASFSVAVNSKRGDEEYVSFFDCEAWGSLAENVAGSLRKGDRVIASGTLKQDRFEVEGKKRSAVILKADSVGPDLRWASVSISKNQKPSEGGSNFRQEEAF